MLHCADVPVANSNAPTTVNPRSVSQKTSAQPMSSTWQKVLQSAVAGRSTFYSEGDTGKQRAVATVLKQIYEEDLLGPRMGSDRGVNPWEEAELDC